MNLREKARQYDSSTDDLNFPTHNHQDELQQDADAEQEEFAHGEPVIFADDVVDDDGAAMDSSSLTAHNRNKWLNSGLPVQCHECKRFVYYHTPP